MLVIATEKASDVAALAKIPTFARLQAVGGKHTVYTDATLTGAMYFISPLSLPYVLERLSPKLDEALQSKAPAAMMSAS